MTEQQQQDANEVWHRSAELTDDRVAIAACEVEPPDQMIAPDAQGNNSGDRGACGELTVVAAARRAQPLASSDQSERTSWAPELASKVAEVTGKTVSKASSATVAGATRTFEAAQALLASDISGAVNKLVSGALSGPASIYDKAMDTNYLNELLRPELGGSYHRLFDGSHTIVGAAKAVRQASPDDTIIQEAFGAVSALLKDASTPRGLPIATWDKSNFDSTAAFLNDTFSIPKNWLYEINTYDVADLLGASVSVVAVMFGWNSTDTETFAQLAAATCTSALVSSNPLLLLVAVVALARSYDKARKSSEYHELADGGCKGVLGTTAVLACVAAVNAAGGSAALMILVGLTAAVLAHRATREVSIASIVSYLSNSVSAIEALRSRASPSPIATS